MSEPLVKAQNLATYFGLNPGLAADAALVVNNSYYHHKHFTTTGSSLVDDCYKLLCSHTLSPAEYLYYRNNTQLDNFERSQQSTTH